MASPYANQPESRWASVTNRLITAHPLSLADLRRSAIGAWASLWQTTVGAAPAAVPISDLRVPATVVGYFFEVLLARELANRFPDQWRGNQRKDEKDLVYLPKPSRFSVEVKSSGQCGFKIYGNRSTGQTAENEELVKKERAGFYLTVNFYERSLTLLRFGWLDEDDWEPQRAPTGQMSGLKARAYAHKLVEIPGNYRRGATVLVLDGVGGATAGKLAAIGVRSVGDLIDSPNESTLIDAVRRRNAEYLSGCSDELPC